MEKILFEEEINKIFELKKKIKEEASKIKDTNNQQKNGGRLDNGNSGGYTKLTKKYQKLIEVRLNKKIWNK